MKIVSWNCNGGLRNKLDVLANLEVDIYIIQECEDPARSTTEYQEWAGQYLWRGDSKNKGIGIFPKNENSVQQLDWLNEFRIEGLLSASSAVSWNTRSLKLFLPFRINKSYSVVGVWTKGSRDLSFGYIGQLWKYLQLHRVELSEPKTMLIGDLNSNVIWDQKDRWWNHSDVIAELSEINKVSLYHFAYEEDQGYESKPTFYLHRNKEKAYHIDYAFVSTELAKNSTIEIGDPIKWLDLSDHMPLIIKLSE